MKRIPTLFVICTVFSAMLTLAVPCRASFKVDDSNCMQCHTAKDDGLHSIHSFFCNNCHEGSNGKGTVSTAACIVCHPLGDAGKCALVAAHGARCSGCHSTCDDGSTNTSSATRPCFAESMYGRNSAEAGLLRHYRDDVLSKSAAGRTLIAMYYRLSPVLNVYLHRDTAAAQWVRDRTDQLLELLQKYSR